MNEPLNVMDDDKVAKSWLGLQVRRLRRGRGLSLQKLSVRSGVSVSMLSQIERGVANPSVRSLQRVAEALETPASQFFLPSERRMDDDVSMVGRSGARAILSSIGRGVTKELVSPDASGSIEMLILTLERGASSGPEPYSHKGEEVGLVMSGLLMLEVDGRSIALGPGDSFQFRSTRPHRFENAADGQTTILWVTSPPLYRGGVKTHSTGSDDGSALR